MGGGNKRKKQKRSHAGTKHSRSSKDDNTTNTVDRSGFGSSSPHIVCAISENLAKETCVASLDARAPVHLQVTKQGNGQTYAETLAYLEVLAPKEILMNEGRAGSTLARKIVELFSPPVNDTGGHGEDVGQSRAVVKFISRACFDQTKGGELLPSLAREETYDASVLCEYIILSSAHAVLNYIQQNLGVAFARRSLYLEVNSGGATKMAIDRSSLLQLELLQNKKTGKSKCSLIATIDYTKTSVGSRLLRTNLMSPPARLDTINSRLDLVEAFLASEDFFYNVLGHLKDLPCLDKMLSNVALVPHKRQNNKENGDNLGGGVEVTKKIARKGISALIEIKTILTALPDFTRVLEDGLNEIDAQHSDERNGRADDASTLKSSLLLGLGAGHASKASCLQQQHLLRAVILAMRNPALNIVLESISSALTSSTTAANRGIHAMKHEECFALQADDKSTMAVVRKAFLLNVEDIYRAADVYAEQHGFFVSVRHSASRGYYLAVPEGTILPNEFIHPSRSGRYITCTTEEVLSLNIRAQDNYQDLLIMTDARIQKILDVARAQYDALASLSDAVAILDLCHSNADCVSHRSNQPWCRPFLTCDSEEDEQEGDEGGNELTIQNGRYLIDVSNSATSSEGTLDFVANDVYVPEGKPFTVITGINGSGKSTYLKQVAIIVIMAHCGSFVPAEHATIPIRDRLCTRIGNTDDPEHNISTFMHEMKETAFICRNATSKSLLLIDELGRATSNEDGVALAWAVSECLLRSGAIVFFVTHYPQVTLLGQQNMYASVQNQHLEATIGTNSDEGGQIAYTHKIKKGHCTVGASYGVELAHACGWPADVLRDAKAQESDLQPAAGEANLFPQLSDESEDKTDLESFVMSQLKPLARADGPIDLLSLKQELQTVRNGFDGDELGHGAGLPRNADLDRDQGQQLRDLRGEENTGAEQRRDEAREDISISSSSSDSESDDDDDDSTSSSSTSSSSRSD